MEVIKQLIVKVKENISILKHINTKKNMVLSVKEYEFIAPDFDEVNYILKDTIKDCRKNYFHSFGYRCVYDIKYTNIKNNEEVILTNSIGYMEFNSQSYGLSEKHRNARNIGFLFNQIVKLTIKFYSSLSNINIHYYLKSPIPILHRQFFRIISQNPKYVRTHCNDLNNFFSFWMSEIHIGKNLIMLQFHLVL